MRAYSAATFLASLAGVDVAECFRPSWCRKTTPSPRAITATSCSLSAKRPEQDEDGAEVNGSPPKKRKRRLYCDFPSFVYDPRSDDLYPTRKSRRQPIVVRFRGTGGEERVFRTTAPPWVVSVPRKQTKQPSFWSRLIRNVVGTDFEPAIIDIGNSARRTRLLNGRAYARAGPFAAENVTLPPSLSDLSPPARQPFDGFWISTPARLLSFAVAYLIFPALTGFFQDFVSLSPDQLDEITSRFGPGISILYGTFISLTLSILYNRQRTIQDNVAVECSLLVLMTRNLLSLFKKDRDRAIEAGQCAADQIRTLVRSSRGAELMLLMYSDPYARMLELVDDQEQVLFEKEGGLGRSANLLASCRDTLKDLNKLRANRLSDEALALPPTHFLILNILTLLILASYTISIVPTVNAQTGAPANESSLLFGILTTVYVLFYNFASDLNNPFQGVYQIRRSCAASHLLEAKWFIANHPLLSGQVDFEEVEEEVAGVQIRSPGLGDLWFERDEIYVDSSSEQPVEEDLS